MNTLPKEITRARSRGVPFVAVSTPDQPALAAEIRRALVKGVVVLRWDAAAGLSGDPVDVSKLFSPDEVNASISPAITFSFGAKGDGVPLAVRLPNESVLVALNLQKFLGDPAVLQGVLNLRDSFKARGVMLVMLAHQTDLPAELRGDTIVLDDPLPDDAGYEEVLKETMHAAEITDPKGDPAAAVASVRGLSAFVAEQVFAMSLESSKNGIDLARSWKLKQEAINQIPGLTMHLDGPLLEDVKGQDGIVSALCSLFGGPDRPELVVLIDEVEKKLAGLGSAGGPGDNTGVSQDSFDQWLIALEEWGWKGMLWLGVPGAGKTMLAKAVGKAHGVPLIRVDLGAQKAKYVGESEARSREAMRAIRSIGRDKVLVIATCNKLDVLPPEFRSRFRMGLWYFDLPGIAEVKALWQVYLKKYGQDDAKVPLGSFAEWTGREIRNCCEVARAYGMKIPDAARFVVPVTKSDPDTIKALQSMARGRFLSASTGEVYSGQQQEEAAPGPRRKISA